MDAGTSSSQKDPMDQVIQDVLEADACAITFYSGIVEKYRPTVLVTNEIFEDLLRDEVDYEE